MSIAELQERIEVLERRLAAATARPVNTVPLQQAIEIARCLACQARGVSEEQFSSRCRTEEVAWARMVSMRLLWCHTGLTLREISFIHGGRVHGTALHAIRRVPDRESNDRIFRDQLARVEGDFRKLTGYEPLRA
jgi:chromosomal replication initiation ATPase DnaA